MASNPHQHTPGARPGEVSPIPVPSTPSTREAVPSPATPCDGGTATPLAPAAACPVCLDGPSSPPDERDAIFPCCGAYAHLSCILQCAHHHGQCPNCREDLRQLLHDPGFTLRCEQAGLSLQPTALDGAQTAFTTVRGYSTRTFSRADAAEPSEPLHIRALCCPRLAGPAMGFLELPDRAMHWAPLPHRGTYGISSWTPMWMCMRCQRELPAARVQVPHPRPSCPNCCVPFAWEVDIRHAVERWVCSRCPFAGPAHPLALQQLACSPSTSDADRIGQVDSIGGPCAV